MPIGRTRAAIDALPAYRPGKAAVQAEDEHGISDAIKLASNENPYPPVPSVVEAAARAASDTNRYADHRAEDLRAALSSWLEVRPGEVTVGNGSVEILRQVAMTYLDPADEVLYPWLSFEAYPILVQLMGATSVRVPLVDHAFDLGAVADAVTDRTKLILLASPNNPTGTAVGTDEIGWLVDRIPDHVMVVIDEAYREFVTADLGDPIVDLLPARRNVIVTRTFSKAYGLAALRVGYAVADSTVIADLDKVMAPFSVNGVAQAASIAAIEAAAEFAPLIEALVVERERIADALERTGITLPDRHANFVYLPLGDRTDEIYLGLERAGVVTRPFSGEGIRVTVGTPEENDRFLATLDTLV